jgi:hypothetical protein
VTRSHKFNDKDHAGLAEGTVLPQDQMPKYFAKNGFADADPKKTKKNGGGRANWYVCTGSFPKSRHFSGFGLPFHRYLTFHQGQRRR